MTCIHFLRRLALLLPIGLLLSLSVGAQIRMPAPLVHFALVADSIATSDSLSTLYGVSTKKGPYPNGIVADTLPPRRRIAVA